MTDFSQYTDQQLAEAIAFYRRQRNGAVGLNESAHMRAKNFVRLAEAEQARRLEEAVQVDKKNYSWGKMITVRHGSSHSFPLHPEHQEKIKNLKDGESTAFKDETGSHVTAHREGDKVHLKLRGANQKTTVAHSHFTEEVEQIDELSKKTLGSYVKKASTDQYLKGQAVQYHTNKANDSKGSAFEKESKKKHMNAADTVLRKASNRDTGIGRAVDRLTKEEVEQIDEVSASTLRSYIDKSRADKKAAMKDRTAAEKNVKTYGMASDKKERDDAARRVGNRNQGISVANKKLGTYPADKAKAKVMAREEVEQIDEISTELKKRYVEKGGQDVVDRFTSRGKYERPRDPSKYTKTGRPKKSAVNSPESVKYREKLDNRRDIVNKVSQEVHGKKRFGEEVVQEDWRDTYWKAAMKKEKQLNKIADADRKKREAAEAKAAAKKAAVKEEVEINEASDLRITKIYNKWPKKATYAVHTPDRKYFKEFDSMEAAKAHHDEKTNNK